MSASPKSVFKMAAVAMAVWTSCKRAETADITPVPEDVTYTPDAAVDASRCIDLTGGTFGRIAKTLDVRSTRPIVLEFEGALKSLPRALKFLARYGKWNRIYTVTRGDSGLQQLHVLFGNQQCMSAELVSSWCEPEMAKDPWPTVIVEELMCSTMLDYDWHEHRIFGYLPE